MNIFEKNWLKTKLLFWIILFLSDLFLVWTLRKKSLAFAVLTLSIISIAFFITFIHYTLVGNSQKLASTNTLPTSDEFVLLNKNQADKLINGLNNLAKSEPQSLELSVLADQYNNWFNNKKNNDSQLKIINLDPLAECSSQAFSDGRFKIVCK